MLSVMIYEKKRFGGFPVVGISIQTSNAGGEAADHINALWHMFHAEDVPNQLPSRVDDTIYALYSDYQGGHEEPYIVTLGCRVKDDSAIPESFSLIHVPEMTYAVAKAAGEQPKAVIETWGEIWGSDMPRAYNVDMEIYGPEFFDPAKREAKIYVSLKESA